jgi:hypothetical protein
MNLYAGFKFEARGVSDQFMWLKILANNQTVYDNSAQSSFEVGAHIDFPATIEFHLSGINVEATTVENKFIQLKSITLDRIEIEAWKLTPNILSFNNRLEKFQNSYWNENGIAKLTINDSDPVCWILDYPELLN